MCAYVWGEGGGVLLYTTPKDKNWEKLNQGIWEGGHKSLKQDSYQKKSFKKVIVLFEVWHVAPSC